MECVEFSTAKLLRKAGYRLGSHYYYHRFPSDFVYDGDPSHAESHRKGEVRIYSDYFVNNEKEDRYSYEAPLQSDVVAWMIEKYRVLVVVDVVKGGGFLAMIRNIGSAETLCKTKGFSQYVDALEAGITTVLRKGLQLLDAHCSECRFYEPCPNSQMYCKYHQKGLTSRTHRCDCFAYPER